ncbi:MAG: hypothetical protein NZ519_00150 [Bacteroidia bacterium]|nr:hypothetical protein [Bacteroidia bacterium]MDW8302881.1 hypothetical protein [Bacteroidia bacterium]
MYSVKLVLIGSLWGLVVLCSCASKVEYSDTFKKIITSEHGIFRGIDFDTPIGNVKKIESIKPEIDDVLGLRYQIQLNENETLFIEYDKQEEKVKNIRAKIVLRNYTNTENLYNELVGYYTHKYGNPKGKDKERYWEVESARGKYYIDLTWAERENTLYLDIRK